MPETEAGLAREVIDYINRLLHDQAVPEMPRWAAGDDVLDNCRNTVMALRKTLRNFARGELNDLIPFRGSMAGSLKAIQANLLHLTWQIQQVAAGDFGQRVDFMGEFSSAFNSMVVQLDSALTELKRSKEELGTLAQALAQEVENREAALEILRQSEMRFRYLAEHDPLTEVFNRRSFFRLAEMEIQRSRLAGEPCCVSLLDVDKFKAFNDRYGHLEGDKALRHICSTSRANLREGDLMGRYGGEEFIFLFAAATAKQGLVAAERIRAAVEESALTIGCGEVRVTVSMGVTEILPDIPERPDRRLLRRSVKAADMALYMAKGSGRNQTRFAPLSAAPARAEETRVVESELGG